MTRFKSSSIIESLSNAVRGLKLALFSQRNFKIEVCVAIVVLILSVLFKFSPTDICIIILTIAMVLICEMLNSIIEFTLDATYKNTYSKLVEMAKDMSAGMVLLSSIISVIVGVVLFGKYLINYFL